MLLFSNIPANQARGQCKHYAPILIHKYVFIYMDTLFLKLWILVTCNFKIMQKTKAPIFQRKMAALNHQTLYGLERCLSHQASQLANLRTNCFSNQNGPTIYISYSKMSSLSVNRICLSYYTCMIRSTYTCTYTAMQTKELKEFMM